MRKEHTEFIPSIGSLSIKWGVNRAVLEAVKQDFRQLVIQDGDWLDLKFLLPHRNKIQSLMINEDNIDWKTIEQFEHIKAMSINGWFKAPIDFSCFQNLVWLDTYWNEGYENGSIYKIPNLRYLKIIGWKETDCEKLKTLTNLEFLELVNCRKLESMRGIESLPIYWLDIYSATKLTNCDAIGSCHLLRFLCLEACKRIENYDFLRKLGHLYELSIQRCAETPSLSPLKSLESLESLLFHDTPITDGNTKTFLELRNLKRIFFAHKKHYNLKEKDVKKILDERWDHQEYKSKVVHPRVAVLGMRS